MRLCLALIFALPFCNPVNGQADSIGYTRDTAAYFKELRMLLETYTKEYDRGVRLQPFSEKYNAENLTVVEDQRLRRLRQQEMADTSGCYFNLTPNYYPGYWKVTRKNGKQFFPRGNTFCEGTFLVFRSESETRTLPIGRHLLYWKNGNLRSAAHFDRCGVPIADSIFDRNGRYIRTQMPAVD